MANEIHVYYTAPNQRIVKTSKTLSNSEATYGICNIAAVLTAAKTLSDRAFKLYIRMNLHQNNYTYALSPIEIRHSIGMSDKRYREAVTELIEKGYLVNNADRPSLFTFYEYPQLDNAMSDSSPIQADNTDGKEPSLVETNHPPFLAPASSPPILEGEILHHNTNSTDNNSTSNSTGNRLDEFNRILDDVEKSISYDRHFLKYKSLEKENEAARLAKGCRARPNSSRDHIRKGYLLDGRYFAQKAKQRQEDRNEIK